jgi:hypothetical protein
VITLVDANHFTGRCSHVLNGGDGTIVKSGNIGSVM